MRVKRLDHFGVDVADLARALFLRPDRAPADPEQVRHPLFAWEDLKNAQALFSNRGVPHHAPIDWGDHDCIYFQDPDGNLLELVGYRP